MRRALAEAERGRGAVEPNPMVGAVVVSDGTLVGFGHHVESIHPRGPFSRRQKCGQHANQRRFAGAVRTEKAEDLALLDGKGEALDGRELAKPFDEPPDVNRSAHDTGNAT